MDNHIFRSALGGFNRQDVMEYIEKTQKQSEEAAAVLEKDLEELRRTESEARQALEERTREKEELEKKLAETADKYGDAKANWESQAKAKEAFRRDVAQRDDTIRDMTEENQRLFHRVQELEEEMEDLRREKEKVTQLELDAHRRSDEIVLDATGQAELITSQAEAQAAETVRSAEAQAQELLTQAQASAQALLRQAEEHVARTVTQYSQLHDSFEAITSHITSELRKLDATASQLPISFNRLKEGLGALLEQTREHE